MIFPKELERGFKSFVAERGGLYFKDHDLRNLKDAVVKRVDSLRLGSVASYYNLLTMSDKKEDEFRELLNLLTINHTYFFRNEPHFKVLKEKVLPEIINKNMAAAITQRLKKPTIRVWSAGCSTGQEPYSIAIVIRELLENIEDWDIQILATDASEEALSKAREGVYSENSMKHLPKEYLEKYFTLKTSSKHSQTYEISSVIKNMVNFGFFNLVEEDYPVLFDVILCRNVVIYFELDTTIKVMSALHESLSDDGYLFIGYSETLQYMPDKFQMMSWDDAIYYQKASKQKISKEQVTVIDEKSQLDKVLDNISRQQAAADLNAELKEKEYAKNNIEGLIIEIIKATHLKDYDKALSLIEQANNMDKYATEPYYLAAEIYMNQGDTDKARNELEKALKTNSLYAPAHYLLGCAYMEKDEDEKAKEYLKKALYIEKDFLLAHFYIAHLYKNEHKISNAIREYRNTLKVLSKSSPEDIIAYSGGFNAATLMSVCRDNIERLKESV